MKDKKEVIDQIIKNTKLDEKVEAAFSEVEDQVKEKIREELETALREKIKEELEKKARRRMIKTVIAAAAVFCTGFFILKAGKKIIRGY